MSKTASHNRSEAIMSIAPNYFIIAKVVSIEEKLNIFHLEVPSNCYLVIVCSDSCAINRKASRILEEKYGTRSPFNS